MFEFALPWLLILLPLPLLARRKLKPADTSSAAVRVPFFNLLKAHSSKNNNAVSQSRLRLITLWLIWILAVIALASPQRTGEPVELSSSGRDLLLAVDISGSMREPDMVYNMRRITRLSAVKAVVGNFVETRKNDRLGLVLFGTQAFLQAPLTYDIKTVQTLLYEAEVGFAGEQTAIGDAVALSVKRLRENSDNQRVIILLTDGENTAGTLSIDTAIDLAVKSNTKVYPIGFTPYDREVDNRALNDLAEKTGGKYFRARSTDDLIEIHKQLDLLEPIEQSKESFRPIESLFYWPLAGALLLSLLLALSMISFPRLSSTSKRNAPL